MDLLSYFRVLRRRWFLIIVCMIIGAGLGVASTTLESKTKTGTFYKATNTLIFDDSNSSTSVKPVVKNINQIAILATSGSVPNAVAKALGSNELGRQLAEQVVTTTNSVTTTLDITATDPSPRRAVQLADEFAKQLELSLVARDTAQYDAQKADLQQQLANYQNEANGLLARLTQVPPVPDHDTVQKQYDSTQNQYYDVYGQLQSLTAAGVPTSRLTTLESAQAIPIPQSEYQARLRAGALGQNHFQVTNASGADPLTGAGTSSVFQDKTSRGILGAVLGLLVGIGLAVGIDRIDRRIRTRAEAEAAFGLPVLAEVPSFKRSQAKSRELLTFTQPQSRTADAFRAIKTSLLFQASGITGTGGDAVVPGASIEGLYEPGPVSSLVVMVTSASPREGKTTTSANLAVAFAEAGESVLVVNCDFRRPTIHEHFGVEDRPRTVQSTQIPNLKIVTNVLTDPSANPAQIVAAQRQVVAAARERFAVIILDTAPMLAANDAVEAVGAADLVLLVARAAVTTADQAERAMEILTRLEAPLAGVVLDAASRATNDYYYYYQQPGRFSGRGKRKRAHAYHGNGNGNGSSNGAVGTPTTNGSGTSEPTGEQYPV